MNAKLITDLEIIRNKLDSIHAEGRTRDYIANARILVEAAIHEAKEVAFRTPYSERNDFALHPHCACGEPHISKRIVHRYDGKPCFVKDA